MGMREKLIELMKKTPLMEIDGHIADAEKCLVSYVFDSFADNLVDNGVTIPVRCKDCKHWLKDVAGCTEFVGRCKWANYMVGATGYCAYGERKDNETV